MKKFAVALVGVLAFIYLLNPTAGLLEFIPDNVPLLGNVDDATATAVLLWALRYFGWDLTNLFRKERSLEETTK